jgi:predicted cation transporter
MFLLATFPWGHGVASASVGVSGVLVALPIASKKVEHNLELFFLAMAVAGATLAGIWSGSSRRPSSTR